MWSEPYPLDSNINTELFEGCVSVAESGNIYYCSDRYGKDGDWGILVSKLENGEYLNPERLPAPANSDFFEGHPYIAPNESYILFSSNREGGYGDVDIYVSFNDNNIWSEPKNLGDKVNTPSHEVAPYVSPDGKYLFFCSFKLNPLDYGNNKFTYVELKNILNEPGNGNGDIYWVEADFIYGLK